MRHPLRGFVLPLVLVALLGGLPFASAQPAPTSIRLASVAEWVVARHRARDGKLLPEFRTALDAGVVDRVVFAWQRGVIQRRSLVGKPIRVVTGAEGEALGARGEWELRAVARPQERSAWTMADVIPVTARPDDVLILEVGGELGNVAQVLETLVVATSGGWQELPLVRRAVVPAVGVPVIQAYFGRPVSLPAGVSFQGADGVGFLVVRSPVEVQVNGGVTANGPADVAPFRDALGDWREGDRVLIRLPMATLQAGAPPIGLGWKDRIFREGGPDIEFRGRARLPGSILR